MRSFTALVALATLALASGVSAGVPDPAQSGCSLKGFNEPCQFRFRADGALDCMTVCVTLRDFFTTPVPDCSTSAGISLVGPKPGGGACGYAAEGAAALCSCCPLVKGGLTDAGGVVLFEFKQLGGRGVAQVCVTAHCVGTIPIACKEFNFTSPDLNASCNAAPMSAATVLDLGIWAQCLGPSPPCASADYDCSCMVGVIDMGIFAGGLGVGCGSAACP